MQNTKNKSREIKRVLKILSFVFVIFLEFRIWGLKFAKVAFAQGLSLSISPPIVEVMIMPGKEVNQTFVIGNHGSDGYATFIVSPFFPKDEYGNISADDNYSGPVWLTVPEKVFIRAGEEKSITLKIAPAADTGEKDYYFTLFYELDSGNTAKAKIGANILVSVSKDGRPTKKAAIAEFGAPRVIDSLQKLTYTLRIKNTGQFLFKPVGAIDIKPTFGKNETLALAPLNIITSSIRAIPCLENESPTACRLNKKVLLGIYKATVTFTTDEVDQKYSAQTTTVAFPFSIIFTVTTLYLGYSLVKHLTLKK